MLHVSNGPDTIIRWTIKQEITNAELLSTVKDAKRMINNPKGEDPEDLDNARQIVELFEKVTAALPSAFIVKL